MGICGGQWCPLWDLLLLLLLLFLFLFIFLFLLLLPDGGRVGVTGKTIIITVEGGRGQSTTTTTITGQWSICGDPFDFRRRRPISTLGTGTATMTTNTTTTTKATRPLLSYVPLTRPAPPRGLGNDCTGRGDIEDLVPGGAGTTMEILG